MTPRPLDYRSEIVAPILHALSAGEWANVVGMSGVGKTNVISQLQRPDVQRHHLGDNPALFCVVLDANMLAAWDGWGFLEGLLEALVASAGDDLELRERAAGAHTTVIRERGNYVAALRLAGEVLGWLCQRTPVALICDEFDPLFAAVESTALRNLRALRDRYKYRLTLLAFTREPLVELREDDWDAIEPFVELLTLHELGLKPLSPTDSLDEVTRIVARYGQTLTPEAAAQAAQLSGGHPALIRALVRVAIDQPSGLAAGPGALARTPTLRLECAKIWQQLDGDEQDALRQLAHGRQTSLGRGIMLKGLALPAAAGATVFSPLLAHYIQQIEQPGAAPQGSIQINLERRQVLYYGEDVSGVISPLEYRLLAYLWEHLGEICPLPEVARVVYGEEFRVAPGTTRLELSDELERLRVLARRLAERLRRLTPAGSPPLFSIHRMRGLRLG